MAKEIEEQMEATIETINEQFSPDGKLVATSMPELPIHSTNQILDKLLLMHRCVGGCDPSVRVCAYVLVDCGWVGGVGGLFRQRQTRMEARVVFISFLPSSSFSMPDLSSSLSINQSIKPPLPQRAPAP